MINRLGVRDHQERAGQLALDRQAGIPNPGKIVGRCRGEAQAGGIEVVPGADQPDLDAKTLADCGLFDDIAEAQCPCTCHVQDGGAQSQWRKQPALGCRTGRMEAAIGVFPGQVAAYFSRVAAVYGSVSGELKVSCALKVNGSRTGSRTGSRGGRLLRCTEVSKFKPLSATITGFSGFHDSEKRAHGEVAHGSGCESG